MNSVVLPLFAVVLAATACGRSDYSERQAERERLGTGRGMTHEEVVGQTETTGAKLDEQTSMKDKDKIRQDALAEGKQAGMAEANAACDAEKDAKAKAAAEQQKKAKEKKAKAKDDSTSMTAPIPTPMPPSPPPPAEEPTSTTTTTSEPMPAPTAEQNKSTTLGDSTSGMYTGGKGSYGGTATWGTGPKK